MSNRLFIQVLAFFLISCQATPDPLHQLVNPFVGTGGHGHTYPGATLPFGMVQLSPDTRLDGWDGCGGYHYSDSLIYGFSHTHLQGTGVSDYGDILFAPCTQFNPQASRWSERYASRFSHETEQAEAGYYRVFLEDQKILAELTATERVGIHRYQLTTPDTLTLVVDMQHRDALKHYSIYPLNDSVLVGHRVSDNWAREQHVYFVARFDRPFEWRDQLSELTVPVQNENGDWEQEIEYVPVFACDFGVVEELNASVALSFVSIEGALANLEAEANLPDFDAYRQLAARKWDEQLGRIEVESESEEKRKTFYTALYHCFTTPNLANDVTGQYRGTDLGIHQLEASEGSHYTVFSLWDTFRALHPLLNWIEPTRSRDFVRSMLRMYSQGGQLPVWELASNYTGCMIGYHSVPVIEDAMSWGVNAFDRESALAAMIQAADSNHLGLPAYRSLGYIPLDMEHESVSKTLEYAFDDACIAQFAARISTPFGAETAERFRLRALHYRNLFNRNTGFFQPKRAAAWLENFDPREVNFNYTEANGWQYNFFVPHDINGHMDLMGGAPHYLQMLESMFSASSETTGRNQADITGLIGQYAHGNEPSHHMAYLFPFVGAQHRTAELVSEIRDELYSNAPDGLSGNEDCGQMSAWYVWSALGMYPVCPGGTSLIVGTPLFKRAVVSPNADGPRAAAPLTISASGSGPYVQHLMHEVNDEVTTCTPSLTKENLLRGGELHFSRSSSPTDFGHSATEWPVQRWNDAEFIPVPVIQAPRTFRTSCEVTLESAAISESFQIEYRVISNSEKTSPHWINYTAPFSIDSDVRIEARCVDRTGRTSATVSHPIVAVSHNYLLTLETNFNAQYAAGGSQALIDGIVGGNQFQTGDWQGFWGEDVSGTIDLQSVYEIESIGIGALRDIRPWIFLPRSIQLETSVNGEDWTPFGTATHLLSDADEAPMRHTFKIERDARARFIRFVVTHFGSLPEGHLGAGNPSWTFLDEIQIQIKR